MTVSVKEHLGDRKEAVGHANEEQRLPSNLLEDTGVWGRKDLRGISGMDHCRD